HERLVLAPYISHGSAGIDLPFWKPISGESTVSTLVSLVETLHKNISYEYREEGPARSPEETIQRASGACRDTALLLAAVARGLGLAVRVVSGFLTEFDVSSEQRVAEGAMHAWCEVFLPGAGWVGLDGTNGVFCDHCYLPCAAGLTMEDVAPLLGSYYGQERVESALTSTIRLTLLR
ncbi:MAG: transglutaminase family protein, partial [Verrucomicrobiia bacterium]